MKNVLHIISSPRGAASYSIRLGNAIVEKIENLHPGSLVVTRNVSENALSHLTSNHLASFFTPKEERTLEHLETIKESDQTIAELKAADIIVIGVPFYNFGIPSSLKAWVDHICRAGETFSYTADGPKGLLTDKKVYIAMASGGVYSEGPMQFLDSVSPYFKNLFGFLGVSDVEIVRAEGTKMPDVADKALEKGLASVKIA